jgi:hypothetical protein
MHVENGFFKSTIDLLLDITSKTKDVRVDAEDSTWQKMLIMATLKKYGN